MKPSYRRIIVLSSSALAVILLLCGAGGYLLLNWQRVIDQFRVWQFTPPAVVTEQMSRDGMSGEGRFLYLASHPVVESQRDFNQTCAAATTDSSILGCYLEHTKRIYLFHETDSRLDGTEEVMAAHEMLRAAWDRMSPAQRAPLVTALDRVLADNSDPGIDLTSRYGWIKIDDPTDEHGELYAIVGTDVAQVGPVLEASYDRYLTPRTTIVDLSAHARAYEVALKAKVDALSTTMDSLNTTIDSRSKKFNRDDNRLDSDVKAFNRRADTPGGFFSQSQFEAARGALIRRQDALKRTLKQINQQIRDYNADLKALEELDKTAAGLMKSLNVTLDALPDVTA